MRKLAAVTGGTGFLGRTAVLALIRNGWRVRLLARRSPVHPQFRQQELEVVFGDLADTEALRRLVRGADAVVHAAGLIKARSRASLMAVNGDGSGRVAGAIASAAPTARLVHISSLAAREPMLSDYAESKRAGEEAARAACGSVPWVIVRPPAIYGPWDTETLAVFRAAKGPLAPLFHGPEARLCLIHAEDAAQAIAALCISGPSSRIFEISDERRDGYPWRSVLEEAARAVGGAPRIIRVPPSLVRLGGILVGAAGHLIGRNPILTYDKVREMLHPDWSSSPNLQPPPELWQPRIGLAEGFADTVRWYRDARWM